MSSERTPQRERAIAGHPSIKPQSFLRRIVYASLPLGVGVVADPFMGSGSTIAAAEAIGLCGVGVGTVSRTITTWPEWRFHALSDSRYPTLTCQLCLRACYSDSAR